MNAKPISEKKESGCGSAGLMIFGAVFFLVGVVFMGLVVVMPVMDWNAARGWPSVEATILSSQIIESHDSDGSSYRAEFVYQYEVNGRKLENNKYSFFRVSGSRKGADRRLAKHPVGSKTTCFYDPQNPEESVLKRTLGWELLFGLIPLIFIMVGGGIMYAAKGIGSGKIKKSRAGVQTQMTDGLPARSANPPTSNTDSRDESNGRSSVGRTSIGRSGVVHPDDILDQQFDGPLKLKPEMSRLGVLCVVAVFCLFWNGIVSIFVFALFTEMDGIWGRLGMGLFLIPFVVIGLVLLAYFFYVLLGLFNPKVEIALSNGAVALGDEFDVAWEVSGNSSRLRSLDIHIEGQERATYRRGTSTYTDTESFEKIVVANVTKDEEVRFGSATLRIPATSMHTLDAGSNEIKWTIEVVGVVPFWPDVIESYTFRVKPS